MGIKINYCKNKTEKNHRNSSSFALYNFSHFSIALKYNLGDDENCSCLSTHSSLRSKSLSIQYTFLTPSQHIYTK